jgi:hypothetical protein
MSVFVDTQSAGGIDDDRVVQLLLGAYSIESRATFTGSPEVSPRRGHRSRRPSDWTPFSGAYTGTPARSPTTCELRHGVRTLQVGGDEQRRVAGILQPVAEFAGERGLAGALQAGEHDDRRRVLGEVERAVDALAEHMSVSSSLTILTTCCAGLSASDTSVLERAFAYARGEGAHHVERHVGVEQRAADLADRAVDIRVGKLALALEMLECIRETIC